MKGGDVSLGFLAEGFDRRGCLQTDFIDVGVKGGDVGLGFLAEGCDASPGFLLGLFDMSLGLQTEFLEAGVKDGDVGFGGRIDGYRSSVLVDQYLGLGLRHSHGHQFLDVGVGIEEQIRSLFHERDSTAFRPLWECTTDQRNGKRERATSCEIARQIRSGLRRGEKSFAPPQPGYISLFVEVTDGWLAVFWVRKTRPIQTTTSPPKTAVMPMSMLFSRSNWLFMSARSVFNPYVQANFKAVDTTVQTIKASVDAVQTRLDPRQAFDDLPVGDGRRGLDRPQRAGKRGEEATAHTMRRTLMAQYNVTSIRKSSRRDPR